MIIEPDQIDQMAEWDARLELRRLVTELATLRAKADAYDKGVEAWEIMDEVGEQVGLGRSRVDAILDHLRGRVPLEDLQSEWWELEDQGYTCRKVKVCEVVG